MICIVDYGLGNIKAFANLYNKLNIDFMFAKTPSDLSKATKIILPGVGAFDHAMDKLNNSGLRETLDDLVLNKEVPVIGICVGMQMMADGSDEGIAQGLGWIPGRVKRFKRDSLAIESEFPLPHMGWNNLILQGEHALTKDFDQDKLFYFLHSYYFEAKHNSHVLATADYGFEYACIVGHKNIHGIQCHPEKSHHNGVTLLKNFASL
ncbi:imidazole glycerol phosphate synthase subunit HisH [Pseudoalteromonas sp. KS88]|uniref:imidazole glycerol phosphate synthase subunit HisH n=1 Tax=Pseudoalteromonas sp. KS88 TaxID=2109918 RepID=UPI00108186D6|nr:imidazole glycerol phosphate synthase subunit HisH [Pseudoalteromonas sp. KS88]TGE75711.1 imidazole glycerol phosphate synthase subunit HisH [Pseudoalteromonas sp. KS88]